MLRSFHTPAFVASAAMVVLLAPSNVLAKKDKGEDPPAVAPAQPAFQPPAFSKSAALAATINGLGMNGSDAAWKSLEQLVTGEIATGKHSKQAAQLALLQFVMHPGPKSEKFVIKLFTDPNEAVRKGGGGGYPAAALREDAARLVGSIGTKSLREAIANLYSNPAVTPEARKAIEQMLLQPSAASFSAQAKIAQAKEAPADVRNELTAVFIERNETAVKQALKLEPLPETMMPSAPPGAAPGGGGVGGALASLASSIMPGARPPAAVTPTMRVTPVKPAAPATLAPVAPATAAPTHPVGKTPSPDSGKRGGLVDSLRMRQAITGAAAPVANPLAPAGPTAARTNASPTEVQVAAMLDVFQQMTDAQPLDLLEVAKTLWTPQFAATLGKQLGEEGGSKPDTLAALASLPTTAARNEVRAFLQREWPHGPGSFGRIDMVSPSAAPPGLGGPPAGKKDDDEPRRRGLAGLVRAAGGGAVPGGPRMQIVEFGAEWQDPGSLIALKTIPYEDRPKANPYTRPRPTGRAMSPAAEKRAQELAERQKAIEAKYDWRDAVERSVRQWNDRFAAVAEEAAADESTASDSTGADEPVTAGFASDAAKSDGKPPAKSSAPATKAAPKTKAVEKGTARKPAEEPPAPKTSVPMPVDLHPGGKIAKEFHVRWPEDLPRQLRGGVTEPLAVHYVRLENEGMFGKAIAHYRTAAKTKSVTRDIEGGKWIDAVQKEDPKKTRSIDVFITREESENKSAKGLDNIIVELLIVEVSPLASEPAPKKPAADAKTSAAR